MKNCIHLRLFFICICFFTHSSKAFEKDSVIRVINELSADTEKLRVLSWFVENEPNEQVWPVFNDMLIDNCNGLLNKKSAHKNLILKYLSDGYNNKGVYCESISKLYEALKWYKKSFIIKNTIKDYKGLCSINFNLGVISSKQKLSDDAIAYFKEALITARIIKDSIILSQCLKSIAAELIEKNQDNAAIPYFDEAIKISNSIQNYRLQIDVLGSISAFYSNKNQFEKALIYYDEFIEISKNKHDTFMLFNGYVNRSICYVKFKRCKDAISQINLARHLAKSINDLHYLNAFYLAASNAYECVGNYKEAFFYKTLFITTKDSLINQKTLENSIAQKYERIQITDSISNAIDKKTTQIRFENKVRQQKLYILFSCIGLFLISIIAFVLFKSNASKNTANRLIEKQKKVLEDKNKQITDSIIYSKRIQNSILPNDDYIKELFFDFFILFQPKDIVSGDFYWVSKSKKNIDLAFIAAIDCTGHGVPGALLSMLGYNILNQAIGEKGLEKPSDILYFLNTELKEGIGKNSSYDLINDGMDIALCSFNHKTNELCYSGAYNPLYLIKDGSFIEVKGDKNPISASTDEDKILFNEHSYKLNKNDSFYIFSDGLADQFGGPSGKKFKYSSIKSLLQSIHMLNCQEQKNEMNSVFNLWKGAEEQVDDVLFIGVKIT